MILRIIACLMTAATLISCATTPSSQDYAKTIASWRNKPASLLVQRWGKPDLRMPGPQQTTLYGYESPSYQSSMSSASPQIGVNVSQSGRPIIVSLPQMPEAGNRNANPHCFSIFLANERGLIIDTHVQGVSCYGSARLD